MCMVVEERGWGASGVSHIACTLISAALNLICCVPPALSFLLPRSRLIKQRRLLLLSTFQLFSTRHFWFAAGLSGSADVSPLYFTLEMRTLSESCRAVRRSSAAVLSGADWRQSAHQRHVQRPHANNDPRPFLHLSVPSVQLHALCWTVCWQEVCREDEMQREEARTKGRPNLTCSQEPRQNLTWSILHHRKCGGEIGQPGKKTLSHNWSQFLELQSWGSEARTRGESSLQWEEIVAVRIYTHLRYLYFKWVFPFHSNSTLLHLRGKYCDFLSGVLLF